MMNNWSLIFTHTMSPYIQLIQAISHSHSTERVKLCIFEDFFTVVVPYRLTGGK
jgi:hypothetical protein